MATGQNSFAMAYKAVIQDSVLNATVLLADPNVFQSIHSSYFVLCMHSAQPRKNVSSSTSHGV